jgi:hypothetical protein
MNKQVDKCGCDFSGDRGRCASFTNNTFLTFNGTGIIINGGSATITNNGGVSPIGNAW